MQHNEIEKYLVVNKKLGLYVAESHYFDARGKRQLTLTDKKELAEIMTLDEANNFISSENPKLYVIIYAEDTDYEEEVEANE